jgi:hypothetical protein
VLAAAALLLSGSSSACSNASLGRFAAGGKTQVKEEQVVSHSCVRHCCLLNNELALQAALLCSSTGASIALFAHVLCVLRHLA